MSTNVKIALIIVFATGVWLVSGLVSKTTPENSDAPKIVLTKVSIAKFIAKEYVPQLTLSSHTAPFREVELKAEIAGIVKDVPGKRGTLVKAGDTVCELMEQ